MVEIKTRQQESVMTRKTEYIESGGFGCAFCPDGHVTVGTLKFEEGDDNHIFQSCVCTMCGEEWKDVYTLTDVRQGE